MINTYPRYRACLRYRNPKRYEQKPHPVANFFFGITFLGSLATKLRIVTEPSHLVSNPSWPVYMLFVQLAAKVVKGL